jgi:hypothetical protein
MMPPPDAARELVRKAAMLELPLPRPAAARVWQRLERERAPRPRSSFRLAGMFLAGAACASLVALLVLRERFNAEPPALLVASDGSARPLRVGDTLPRDSGLSVADLHAAARVVVGPGTQARLERLDRQGATMRLERGSLLLHVLPRPVNAPFLVHTPAFTARVIGTVLRVAVDARGASLVVAHGAVELQPAVGGRSVIVRAGERWPADSTAAPSQAELERLGAGDLEGATFAHFAPAPALPVARPAPSISTLAEENAMYQAGLEALRAHDPRGALALFRLERERFPRGVLARELRTSMIDAYLAMREPAPALHEIDAALADEPHGLRAPELHYLRGTLYRKLDGDCVRAAVELDVALAHARPAPWIGNARRARAACDRR